MSEGFEEKEFEDEGLIEHLKKKSKVKRCMALTKFSRRCRNRASGEKDFCEVHLVKLFGDSLESSSESEKDDITEHHFIHIYDLKKKPIVIDDSFEKLLIHSNDDRDIKSEKSKKSVKFLKPLGGCGISSDYKDEEEDCETKEDKDDEDSENEKIHRKYKQYHDELEEFHDIDDIDHKEKKEKDEDEEQEEYGRISIFDYIEKMKKEQEIAQQISMFEHFEKLRLEKQKKEKEEKQKEEQNPAFEFDENTKLYLESIRKYGGGVIGMENMGKAFKNGELERKFLPILQECHPEYSHINVYQMFEQIKKQFLQELSFRGRFAAVA
jgi:hypothetical protein